MVGFLFKTHTISLFPGLKIWEAIRREIDSDIIDFQRYEERPKGVGVKEVME